MTDTVLKPCPFCGGTAEIKRRGTARMSMLIGCVDCHAEVESGDVCGLTAVENYKWNMRKPLTVREPAATRNLAAAMFDSGFRAGADWSGEEHILHDMGSFRYNEERNAAIDAAMLKEGK